MTKLSRSKIELSLECPRCFWLDMKQGIKRPPPMPYTINNAVDYLLKQEFDIHREKGTPHPVMKKHKIDAVPYSHEKINTWRHNFTGVQFHHKPTDFLVYGAVDDIWVNPEGELMVVDYKATGANQHRIYDSYKRQMEIYQWLLRQNGFNVSPVGYFVFAKVNKAGGFGMPVRHSLSEGGGEALQPGSRQRRGSPEAAGQALQSNSGQAALSFEMIVEPQEGDGSWIEEAIGAARKTFDDEKIPAASTDCEYCRYRKVAGEF